MSTTGRSLVSQTTAHSRSIGASAGSDTRAGLAPKSDCSKPAKTVVDADTREISRHRGSACRK